MKSLFYSSSLSAFRGQGGSLGSHFCAWRLWLLVPKGNRVRKVGDTHAVFPALLPIAVLTDWHLGAPQVKSWHGIFGVPMSPCVFTSTFYSFSDNLYLPDWGGDCYWVVHKCLSFTLSSLPMAFLPLLFSLSSPNVKTSLRHWFTRLEGKRKSHWNSLREPWRGGEEDSGPGEGKRCGKGGQNCALLGRGPGREGFHFILLLVPLPCRMTCTF